MQLSNSASYLLFLVLSCTERERMCWRFGVSSRVQAEQRASRRLNFSFLHIGYMLSCTIK
uniref:Uncharacterized protein n=1 Tax=Setaria italica TaxID=4555 RepID=K3ZYW6_SETIT